MRFKGCERMVNSLFPFGVGQIAAERDTAAAPAKRRKAAHFQKKLAIFLAELRGLASILDFKTRNHRMLPQWRPVEQPPVANHLPKFNERLGRQFAPSTLA